MTGPTGRVADGIDRLPSGRFRARYRDPNTGRPHSKSFILLGDAKRWLRAQKTALDRGEHVDPTDKTSVSAYAREWAESRVYRPGSRAQAQTYLRHVSESGLGSLTLRRVTRDDMQAFVSNRVQAGYSPQTVRNLYTWVKAVFKSAVESRRIVRTPCVSDVRLPPIGKTRVVPLTVDQVRELAAAMPERYRAAVYLQAALGLRVSELLGLQLEDIDFLRRRVAVERQLARGGKTGAELKTEHSKRTLPLARDVVPILAEHVRQYPPSRDGYLFTTTFGNPIRQDRYTAVIFREAVAQAGLPQRTVPHDLRHHFASVLLARGVPVTTVAEYMGHASAALVLRVYGHLMPDADDVVRTALDHLWQGPGPALAQG